MARSWDPGSRLFDATRSGAFSTGPDIVRAERDALMREVSRLKILTGEVEAPDDIRGITDVRSQEAVRELPSDEAKAMGAIVLDQAPDLVGASPR